MSILESVQRIHYVKTRAGPDYATYHHKQQREPYAFCLVFFGSSPRNLHENRVYSWWYMKLFKAEIT